MFFEHSEISFPTNDFEETMISKIVGKKVKSNMSYRQ
jgi:hypothetical protein